MLDDFIFSPIGLIILCGIVSFIFVIVDVLVNQNKKEYLYVHYSIPDVKPLKKGTPFSAGIDIYLPESIVVHPLCIMKVNTGVHLQIPDGHYGIITGRSSITTRSLIDIHGIIDSGRKYFFFIKHKNFTHIVLHLPK